MESTNRTIQNDFLSKSNNIEQQMTIQNVETKVITESKSWIDLETFDNLIRVSRLIDANDITMCTSSLWEKYLACARADEMQSLALENRAFQDGEHTMKFTLEIKGNKPQEGYPLYIALHGGGGCPPEVNDSQWEHMQIYYAECVETGIYVATRGITDSWKLHWEDASFRLYDKLIKTLIAFHDVDPNRVYIMGFSAGGDGVYQIVPRTPDLWAGANMSAGHNNGVRFDNIHQVPFLMQVGELDHYYDRNKVALENYREITRLGQLRGGYETELFLHYDEEHNGWRDEDHECGLHPVLVNNEHVLTENQDITEKNTSAVDWLRKFKRNPYPTKFHWDPSTNAPRDVKHGEIYLVEPESKAALVESRHLCYWLSLGHEPEITDNCVIEACLDKEANTVNLNNLGSLNYVAIRLNPNMLNLQKAVGVNIEGNQIGFVEVKPDVRVMTRTLLERGDIQYVFASEIVLSRDADGVWRIQQDN